MKGTELKQHGQVVQQAPRKCESGNVPLASNPLKEPSPATASWFGRIDARR